MLNNLLSSIHKVFKISFFILLTQSIFTLLNMAKTSNIRYIKSGVKTFGYITQEGFGKHVDFPKAKRMSASPLIINSA